MDWEKIKIWLMEKPKTPEIWKDIGRKLFWLVTAVIIFGIIYSNAEKLNQIPIWLFGLGGVLVLVSFVWLVMRLWQVLEILMVVIRFQARWIRLSIGAIVLVLLLWAFFSRETLLDSAITMFKEKLLPAFPSYEIPAS